MGKLTLFHWKAINHLQQKQKGTLVAENIKIAQQILFQKGMQNIRLQKNWQFNNTPKNEVLCDLVIQLSVLLKSSVTLKNSLQILIQNCSNIMLNQWLRDLLRDIENGLSFSNSLNKHGKYFTYQERQLIYVGEMTGRLSEVCEQIAYHRQQALALKRKIQKILLYPMVVLAISLVITCLLLIFIVPKFTEMYVDNQAALPTFTTILIFFSEILQQYFFHILLLIIAAILFIRFRLRYSFWLNRQKERLISVMPILSSIVTFSRLISFCRSLSLMLQSGIPLNQSLQSFLPHKKILLSSSKLQGDLFLQIEVKNILDRIHQGYSFSESVSSYFFPNDALQMLQVGEETGKLALMLQHIADQHKQKLDHQIDLLSQMLEPLLMLIIGGLIGMIMLGMYLPIFNMGALIQ